jgi:serine/threonine protein phosphatase PrpC
MGYLEKKIGFCTDVGPQGGQNEDAVVCFENRRGETEIEMIVGVADGLGHYAGGDIASGFLVDELTRYFKGNAYKDFAEKNGIQTGNIPLVYKRVLEELNQALYKKRSEDALHPNMGTTFTGAMAYEMELYLAHAGDSQAYRVQAGKIEALTESHTMGAKLQKAGVDLASYHPEYENALYRSFGYRPWIKIDFQTVKVEPNDFICFLTDGCHRFLEERQILQLIQKAEYDPGKASRAVVEAAKENGSQDNMSAACILYVNYMGLEMTKREATARLEI